ncbi:hypothetical protein [Kitasatospora cathayae]|uniref:Uncharacterized protein n=1 Tax=Kitasatospora cathayae TaxID=3004092 RepID=A0ABY7Q0W0_9ACTN|nr:hypothetical protein [Kitasatospora sp. HUAS 3-15]WBP86333.1 hypothetical protein O1G21_11090 [Kitasatospora sp. HUAS 3-15]
MKPALRYPLIWLGCTAVGVTAVALTVRVVIRPATAGVPAARSIPTTVVTVAPAPVATTATATPTPIAAASAAPAAPSDRATPAPAPTARKVSTGSVEPTAGRSQHPAADRGPSACSRDAVVRTYQATGGTATVAVDPSVVCLVSAVPASGYTMKVKQPGPASLVVDFSDGTQTSEISVTSS